MRLTEVVSRWHYRSDAGVVVGYTRSAGESKDRIVQLELPDRKVFGHNVVREWWNKPAIEITYDNDHRTHIKIEKQEIVLGSSTLADRVPEDIQVFRAEKVELLPQK